MIIENTGGQQTVLPTANAEYNNTFERQIAKGMDKYGVVLSTFNDRDAGKDAIEELVDLSVYLTQLRMEHQAYRELLACIIYDNPQIVLPERVAQGVFGNDFTSQKIVEAKRKWGL